MSHLHMRIFCLTKSTPPWECTFPCLTSTTVDKELWQCKAKDLETMTDQMLESEHVLPCPRGAVLCLQRVKPHPRSTVQTSHFSLGSPMTKLTAQRSLRAKNTPASSYKTMCLTLKQPSKLSSVQNVSPSSLILNGTTSWGERQSILTLFSQACTPPSQTTEPSKTLVTSNFILGQQNQPKLWKLTETGSSPGGLLSKRCNSFSLIVRLNSRSTMTILLHTLHQFTQVPIQKSLTLTGPSGRMSNLSTMYSLMNSANFATLKLEISMDMVLTKAKQCPSERGNEAEKQF